MCIGSAFGAVLHQGACSTRMSLRLVAFDDFLGGHDPPRAGPHPDVLPMRIKPLSSRQELRNPTATLILVLVGSRSRAVDPDPVRRLVSERAQWGRRSSSELLPQPTPF